MEDQQELIVIGLSASESHPGHFVMVLESIETKQRLPIIIGEAEAQSIAIAMEGMHPPQPLTHDLMSTILEELKAKLHQVLIYEMEGEVFQTQLHLQSADGNELIIPSRCSDAVALAVRTQSPIFSFDSILSLAIIDPELNLGRVKRGSLQAYSLSELERILEKLVAKEDYKSAARIRDVIEKRK